jgi:hypothetical protein
MFWPVTGKAPMSEFRVALRERWGFSIKVVFEPLTLFHTFPQFFRIPPLPQALSLRQLEPHCVNPATSIRIANKLGLTGSNLCDTMFFELAAPTQPSGKHAPPAISIS